MLPRERFAWVWMLALIVVFAAYFVALAVLRLPTAMPGVGQLVLLSVALGTLGIIAGGARLIDYLLARRRADLPVVDERDRFIEARCASIAYYVLVAGIVLVGIVMPFNRGGWDIVHAALLAIGVAEVVHYGLVAMSYRRGWRV